MSLLKIDDIHVFYGAIHAIKGISFEVNEDEIVTLIGANGAGKSTTLNTIAGLQGGIEGHGPVPRRPPDFPADDRARKPGDGRLHPGQG